MRGGVAIAGWKGFTLVEMLVVLLIMGLTVGLISANVGPDDRELVRIEAERLAQLLSLAESDSRLSGASLGWTSDGSSYRFWRIDDNGVWSSVDDDESLRPRTLPRGMAISGMRVEAAAPRDGMRLAVGLHGESPAFSIEMSLGERHYIVAGSPIGDVRAVPESGTND